MGSIANQRGYGGSAAGPVSDPGTTKTNSGAGGSAPYASFAAPQDWMNTNGANGQGANGVSPNSGGNAGGAGGNNRNSTRGGGAAAGAAGSVSILKFF